MRVRLLAPIVLSLVALSACSRDEAPSSEPQAKAPATQASAEAPAAEANPFLGDLPEDWDAAAVAKAESLANTLRENGFSCNEYEVIPYRGYARDYVERLDFTVPELPLAETYCTTDDDEDITFIVFADRPKVERFIETKRSLLCRRAKAMKLDDFPGFPYVIGDNWMIQPDERETSVRIADATGGEAKMAACGDAALPGKENQPAPAAEADGAAPGA